MFIPFLKVKLEGKQNETCPRGGGGQARTSMGNFLWDAPKAFYIAATTTVMVCNMSLQSSKCCVDAS